jgi:hypothetical protein
MGDKIKLPLGRVCQAEFVSALTRLSQLRDAISGRDAYALMRTINLLEPELGPHKKALDGLLRKHGARGSLDALREAKKQLERQVDSEGKLIVDSKQGGKVDSEGKLIVDSEGKSVDSGQGDQGLSTINSQPSTSKQLEKQVDSEGKLIVDSGQVGLSTTNSQPSTKQQPSTGKQLADLTRRIGQLEPFEQLELSVADPGWNGFIAERAALDDPPVELFLDHKIRLDVDRLPPGALSAQEMRQLTEIVDFVTGDE